ncbi:Sensor histidine kinase MtrB [Corynebacterium oculi]|uniref:Sensor histidine kinase MtrB n=1 Tax=Corynebacterium oculi TaxID=1544416 RepID=A0A0Q0TYE5_9CORY|nr:Sensor histidine kinase MtrB [Corynebacterium oculi]
MLRQKLARWQESIAESWRTSLQVRVIGSMLVATSVVMLILGLAMISIVTQRLVDSKINTADSEIERVRLAVEQQIAATSPNNSVQVRLNSARAALTNRSGTEADTSPYEPVLVVSHQDEAQVSAPQGFDIPSSLQKFVSEGQVSTQFHEVGRSDGTHYNALIIGSPTSSDIPGLQVYLVLSMEDDEETMALMRGLISAAAVIVVVLLIGIAWLLAQQVITPVRSASRIAERLAAGHLRERMSVEGEDEMARLAMSFNSMAESLSKQIQQLKEYGDLQRQFTSDVSHELRTPLTTVRMAADMIAMHADEFDPGTRRATELMTTELDRFEDLLTDLLEISRHDAGVADLSESRLDIRMCVNEAWQQVKHLAGEIGVEVNIHAPEEPLYLTADSRRVERVLRNLLANAIDHSEGNPVEVHLAGNEEAVAVTVTDHGVGLREGQEELVFNRFWRADPSRKRHSGGTGLGLAIAQEDIVLHGGILDAAGTEGVGSQFRVVLPRTPNAPVTHSPLELEAPA